MNRVTVSLDALDVETFQAMGDTDETPETVLRGIEAARMAGLTVKVNTVVRAGYNEHSVEKVAERFVGTDVVVRYIEFMDVGETNSWNNDEVITGEMMRAMLENLQPVKPNHVGEVANRYMRGNQEIDSSKASQNHSAETAIELESAQMDLFTLAYSLPKETT